MPLLTVRHISVYRYRQPVAFGEHRVMFRPRDSYDQRLLSASIDIDPAPASLHWTHDVFGNCVAVARFSRRACALRFETMIEVEHVTQGLPDFLLATHAELYPFAYDQEDMPDLLRSIERQYADKGNALWGWAREFVTACQRQTGRVRTLDLLARITHAIRRDFTYVRREAMGIQPPAQTLKLRSGSCRDFALLMMEAARSLGFAARFVSGYIHSPAAAGSSAGEKRLGGGSTHAWVQVYLPGAGWTEFDPTNGIVGNRDLIRVAVGRDPAQAVPLWGSWTGFPADSLGLEVEVRVTQRQAADDMPTNSPIARNDRSAGPMPGRAPSAATRG